MWLIGNGARAGYETTNNSIPGKQHNCCSLSFFFPVIFIIFNMNLYSFAFLCIKDSFIFPNYLDLWDSIYFISFFSNCVCSCLLFWLPGSLNMQICLKSSLRYFFLSQFWNYFKFTLTFSLRNKNFFILLLLKFCGSYFLFK